MRAAERPETPRGGVGGGPLSVTSPDDARRPVRMHHGIFLVDWFLLITPGVPRGGRRDPEGDILE